MTNDIDIIDNCIDGLDYLLDENTRDLKRLNKILVWMTDNINDIETIVLLTTSRFLCSSFQTFGMIRETVWRDFIYACRDKIIKEEGVDKLKSLFHGLINKETLEPSYEIRMKKAFYNMVFKWRNETAFMSSANDIFSNQHYKTIVKSIEKHPLVIDLIISECNEDYSFLIFALVHHFKIDIPKDLRGDIKKQNKYVIKKIEDDWI